MTSSASSGRLMFLKKMREWKESRIEERKGCGSKSSKESRGKKNVYSSEGLWKSFARTHHPLLKNPWMSILHCAVA